MHKHHPTYTAVKAFQMPVILHGIGLFMITNTFKIKCGPVDKSMPHGLSSASRSRVSSVVNVPPPNHSDPDLQ